MHTEYRHGRWHHTLKIRSRCIQLGYIYIYIHIDTSRQLQVQKGSQWSEWLLHHITKRRIYQPCMGYIMQTEKDTGRFIWMRNGLSYQALSTVNLGILPVPGFHLSCFCFWRFNRPWWKIYFASDLMPPT
jgi:hypothetical protein